MGNFISTASRVTDLTTAPIIRITYSSLSIMVPLICFFVFYIMLNAHNPMSSYTLHACMFVTC